MGKQAKLKADRKQLKVDDNGSNDKDVLFVFVNPIKKVPDNYEIIQEGVYSPEEFVREPKFMKALSKSTKLKVHSLSKLQMIYALKKTCENAGNPNHQIRVYRCRLKN